MRRVTAAEARQHRKLPGKQLNGTRDKKLSPRFLSDTTVKISWNVGATVVDKGIYLTAG
jgi:hypothetical protein